MKINDDHLALWALSKISGIGSARINALIKQFGSPVDIFSSSKSELEKSKIVNKNQIDAIKNIKDFSKFENELKDSIPPDADFMTIIDDKYPSRLKNISDPPPYFYYKGDIEHLEGPVLGVVGTRMPSEYGKTITANIVSELSAKGVAVVSGLAYGIDSVAHKAALKSGGKTTAVFGSSLDIISPSANRKLAENINESGCLISEFPKGTAPAPYNFPVRNRIISGLAEGVLVVESREKSGALITARMALEQDRDIFAIPGNINSPASVGPNKLIKDGAIPVTCVDDIFAGLRWHIPNRPESDIKNEIKLSKEENKLFSELSLNPIHLDELSRKVDINPSKIHEVLLNLELKGYILRKPGNYIVRN